jgi:predicted exporter
MTTPRGTHKGPFLWLVCLVCLLLLAALRLSEKSWLDADFQSLLPGDQSDHWATVADENIADAYAAKLIWLVEGENHEDVNFFSKLIEHRLESAGYSEIGFQDQQTQKWETLTETLLIHRRGLINSKNTQLIQENPKQYFDENLRLLHSPLGATLSNWLQMDPTGLFPLYLNHIIPERPIFKNDIENQATSLLVFSVPAEKLTFNKLADLYAIYTELVNEASKQNLTLSATGAPLYTAYGVHSAKAEMSTLGMASLILLTSLLLINLRSLSALALTLICIISGVIAGVMVTLAMFQKIHVLTLVFGTSLIGISADYALHYLAHSRIQGWGPKEGLDQIFRALRLSVTSSVAAFSALLLLPFPGLQQIGLFMASGLAFSFMSICFLFPVYYKGLSRPFPLTGIWCKPQWFSRYNPIVLFVLVAVTSVLISKMPTADEVREFYYSPELLNKAQLKISSALSGTPDTRFLLVKAKNIEQLLILEENILRDLSKLKQAGAISSYVGVSEITPSIETQKHAADLLRSSKFTAAYRAYMQKIGLDATLQHRSIKYLQSHYEPLHIDALNLYSLPQGTGGFLGCDASVCASRVSLSGVNAITDLHNLVKKYPQARLVDKVEQINSLVKLYRKSVAAILLCTAALASFILMTLYGWRVSYSIIMPPITTCLLSLLIVGAIQGNINLINILALMLLAGISLDYGFFRAFTPPVSQAATSLAISLSAATSALAFGMLSFSATPIISSFGLTIAVGIVIAWLLSWVKLVLES